MRPFRNVRLFYVLALLCTQTAGAADIVIEPRSGSFTYVDAQGDAAKRMTVYTYLPSGVGAKDAKILFALHGASKNARGMRDTWIAHANQYGLMVIAPLFDAGQWPSGAYSYASVMSQAGRRYDPSQWSFSVIEHLFDDVKSATGNPAATYYLYGHSEGGQFVHRLVTLLPAARYSRAVAANAGWYMMPNFGVKYPHGLGEAPVTDDSLRKALGRDFVVMLGDRDTDPNHYQLSKTPQAMAQGIHRYERGHNYFRQARERASELQCAFGWRLHTVPFAAHENSKMARAAAEVLAGH